MDYGKIKEVAQNYQEDMTKFLRAIVKNPGESCDERKHIETIEAEMKKLNFDEVTIDPQGNVCLLYTSIKNTMIWLFLFLQEFILITGRTISILAPVVPIQLDNSVPLSLIHI